MLNIVNICYVGDAVVTPELAEDILYPGIQVARIPYKYFFLSDDKPGGIISSGRSCGDGRHEGSLRRLMVLSRVLHCHLARM